MAPLPTLDLAAAARLLAAFGAARPVRVVAVAGGASSRNFRVETSGAPLFLRVNDSKTDDEVASETRVVEHLAAAGVPTPRPWRTPDGATHCHWHGARVSLFNWVPGRILALRDLEARHTRQVGAALGRLHLAGAGLGELPPGRYTFDAIAGRLEALGSSGDPSIDEVLPLLWDEAEWLPGHRRADLPTGLIHQDLFRDNVLFDGPHLAALLDFEQACGGPFVYDLMVAVLDWCFDEAFDASRARALVAGYEEVRPLTTAERAGCHAEARAAAFRFSVTRITDVYLPRQRGAEVLAEGKDFRRYLARLGELQRLGSERLRVLLGIAPPGSSSPAARRA